MTIIEHVADPVGTCPEWCTFHDTELGTPDSPATLHEHQYYGSRQQSQERWFGLRLTSATAADPELASPPAIMLGVDDYDQELTAGRARELAAALLEAADKLDQVDASDRRKLGAEITRTKAASQKASEENTLAVYRARAAGMSWKTIGNRLGGWSAQYAQQHFEEMGYYREWLASGKPDRLDQINRTGR